MSETFSGAGGCRDVFETLSSVTIDWLVTNDDERILQSRVEFDKQVEELLQQLQPPREGLVPGNHNTVNNMSAMLSTDVFSEMLSSAAQWPDLQGTDFSNMGLDSNDFWFQ